MKFFNIKKLVSRKTSIGMVFPFFNFTLKNPLYLLVHITLRCNRACSYCYQNDGFYQKEEMSLELFENILQQRSKMFIKPYIHLFGGEPLFYADLGGIKKMISKYKVKTSLTTNGDFIDKHLDFLSMSLLKQINISVNPPKGQPLDDHLKSLLEKILQLKKINPKICINLNYHLNPEDYNLLGAVYLFFKNNLSVGVVGVFVVQHFMHPEISGTYDFDCDKIDADLLQIRENNACFDISILPQINDIREYYRTDNFISHKCYVPFLGLSIFPKGNVAPGGGVFGCNYVLGNLNKINIADIWRGEIMQNFKNSIRKKLPCSCARCCQKIYR